MLSPDLFWPRRTFAALEPPLCDYETARFVVLPAPYDSTTTWRSGTRSGPAAIVDASINMELWERELNREVAEVGIHTTGEIAPEMSGPGAMVERIEAVVGQVLDAGKFPLMLGGEHSLTLGGVRALAVRHPVVSVLQIDAHPDLRHSYTGTPYGHGCVMRRCSEIPNVARIVQVGLRSSSREEAEAVPANVTQFWAEDIVEDFNAQLPAMLEPLKGAVYLSFDVDGCDPSWMPETGTPEPGGLSFYQTLSLLRSACRQTDVRALDCVELIGGHDASAFAVARLLYKTMGYLSQ